MSMSNYLENKILEHTLKNTAYTSPTNVYISLHTADVTDAGNGAEVSGGSYARTAATFGSASSGAISNSAAVNFAAATASWGTVTHFGVWDASTSGNLLYHGALTASKTVASGDTLSFAIGDIDISID